MPDNSEEHRIYRGVEARGGTNVPFAKCRCGLVMRGAQEIEEHEKNFSEEDR